MKTVKITSIMITDMTGINVTILVMTLITALTEGYRKISWPPISALWLRKELTIFFT